MEIELNIEQKMQGDDAAELTLCGTVNLVNAPKLFTALNALFSGAMQSILVDLSAVDRMDSSGIATLVSGLNWSRRTGGKFILTGMTDRVRDAFGLAKLEQEFTIV